MRRWGPVPAVALVVAVPPREGSASVPARTGTSGEQIWNRGAAGWRNVVDMPHIWTGALVYLQAMAIERPDLVRYRPWDAL